MNRIFTLVVFFLLISLRGNAQAPATQATNITFSPNGSATALTISWTQGEASNKLVVISSAGGVFTPVNGMDYAGDINTIFTSAADQDGGAGEARIVYGGTGNSVPVTALTASTFYTVRVYQFNPTGFLYNLLPAANNPSVVWFYASTGATTNYIVPAGINSVTAQAWGAGGGGGIDNPTNNGAAGGGGGAYASSVVSVAPASSHTVTIGAGGTGGLAAPTNGTPGGNSSFAAFVVALGGGVVNSGATGAAGGTAGGSTGTIKFSGGNGGNGGIAANQGGGGGGSSATSAGNGVNGGNFSTNTGGAGGDGADGDGGDGGDDDGAPGAQTAGPGTFPGGGGGGRGDANGDSGNGANGLVIVSYSTPVVLSVSSSVSNGAYNAGEVIPIEVTFSENVTVTGLPRITLETNTVNQVVDYTSGSGGTVLTFNYTVQPGDGDNGVTDLDYETISSLVLNGGTIVSTATGTAATLTLPAVGGPGSLAGNKNIKIDTQAPVISTVTSVDNGAGAILKLGDQITFTVDIATTEAGLTILPTTYNGRTITWSTSNGGDTYTATYTVTLTDPDQASPLQLTGVTATDAAGNASNSAGTADVAKGIDATPPAVLQVGAVTVAAGGTVVPGYYNISNTSGITVNVPLTMGDASLDGGTIQLQMRNVALGFLPLGTPQAILMADRTAGFKTIAINDATFTAHARYGNGNILTFNAIVTDAPGNPSTWTSSSTTITVDKTAPAQLTVTTLAATGGRAVTGYYNATNTGFNVTVPLTGGDATLVGGSIQVQIQNSASPGFTSVSGTGLVTISAGPPASQVVAVGSPDLEGTAGFVEGNLGGLSSAETRFLQVRAVVTDIAGNSTNWNQSVSNVDVDQTPPGVISNQFQVYADAGSGGRNVIQFRMTEPLTNHAATPVERTHDFAFVNADNAYGGTGISVGGGTTTGVTNDVRYFDDGSVNGIDGSVNNNELIYVESKNNGDVWSTGVGTMIQYVQLGNGDTSAKSMRDAAGNELGAFNTAVTTGTTTTIASATNGVAPGPGINGGTNNVVVFAFSLTSGGPSITLTNLSLTTSTDPSNKLSNIELWSNSGADNFGAAVNTGLTPTTSASSVDFTGVNLSHSSTSRYYYVVADVNSSFATATPTIQFSLDTDGVTLSSGGKTGSHTGINYTLNDVIAPALNSIGLPSTDPNPTGTVDFTLNFSENVTILNNSLFSTIGTAAGNGESISFSGSGSTYTVTVSNINANGTLGINVNHAAFPNIIEDINGNDLGASLASATYNVFVPPPVNDPTAFAIHAPSTTPTSMTVTWTDVATIPTPTGYLITVERSGASAPTPGFGVPVVDQLDLVNFTTGAINVAQGTQTATFPNMLSGPTYTFNIYPYTNSGATINYKTNSPANASGATPTAAQGRIVPSGSGALIQNIPSTTTAFLPYSAGFSGTNSNLWIQVTDDGTLPGSDNAKTLINSLTIFAGPSNTIGNWNDAIAEARLRSFRSPDFSSILEDNFVTTTNITGNSIVFSGIPTGTDQLGEIDDNDIKYFQLYIRFKNPIDNTNSLPSTIDNQAFDFQFNAATSFGYATGSSTILSPQTAASGGGGSNVVRVNATELRYVQQTTTNTYIANQMTPLVSVQSTDANGNRDLDYVSTVNFASSGGSLIPAPVNLVNGFNTASIVHNSTGTGLQLTASSGILASAISTTYDIIADNQSDIVYEPGSSPTNILYANFQSTLIGGIAANNVQVAQFRMRDGGATHVDADGAPTHLTAITFNVTGSTHLNRVALFNGPTLLAEQAASPTMNFSGFTLSTSGDGSLGAGTDAILSVRVSFKSAVTDNAQIGFQITGATTSASNNSSLFIDAAAGGAVTPTSPNNLIEVVASKYFFINPVQGSPSNSVLANVPMTTAPASGGLGAVIQVEARDGNDNLDLDYAQAVNITNQGNNPMTDNTNTSVTTISDLSFASGILTFRSGFKYDITGNGRLTVAAQTPGIVISHATAPPSPPITITSSNGSDIAESTAGFTYNQNIEYIKYPESNVNISPANPSSPDPNTDDEIKVGQFAIRDGGAAANDLDLVGTELTNITFSLTNAQFINRLALYNGNTELGEVALAGAQTLVSFGPFSVTAPDNGSATLSLFATFKNTVTDNAQIAFAVSSVTVNGAKSTFADPVAAGGATTTNTGDNNRLEVIATALSFINPPAATTASLDTDFPGVSVQAVDVNSNRDLDYNSTVRELSNPVGATMINGPVVNTTQFASGLLNFASTFRYTSGNNGDDVTLTIKAGAGTTCGPTTLCGTSPTITLQSSSESSIFADPTFTYPSTISYVNFQEPSDIQITGTSREIARMLLIDGSRFLFNYGGFLITTDTNNDAFLNFDEDGAATTLNSLTVRITNPSNLRRIALYNGTTEVGEIDVTTIVAIDDTTPSYDFVFSGSPLTSVADNSIAALSIRASFRSSPPNVTDGETLEVDVADAVVGNGSEFYSLSGSYIAGIDGGYQSPDGINRVNVIATKLDFVVQPPTFAGVNRAIGIGSIEAHDQLGLLDTDFNSAAILSAAVPINGSYFFTGGQLDISTLQYGGPGNGTITASAGGLTSDINSPPSVAVQCNPIDVLHVTTSYTNGGAGGVVTSPNLVGGTANKVVFGFKFNAPHTVAGSPNHPRVTRFTITFSQSTVGVFDNLRVFESTNTGFNLSLPEVTTLGASVTQPTSNTLQVDFSGSPRDLRAFPDLSYFLMVDVSPNANNSTPQMNISITDDNVALSGTDNNILVSNGTSFSNTSVPTPYTFAAIFPPSLVSSYPAAGQSNVDINQPRIELFFSVPVWTLDGQILLHDKTTPSNPPIVLMAANGIFNPNPPPQAPTAQPLIFNIPGPLLPNNEYFITIAQGNRTTLKGIMDDSENLFPGISFSGTLFFRTSDGVPPKLLGAGTAPIANSPVISDITSTGATINATFDRNGRAYFMVLSSNTIAPTRDEIKGLSPYLASPVVSQGSFDINSSNPVSQFGIVTPSSGTFTPGTHYVWLYAEGFSEIDRVKIPIDNIAPFGAAPLFTPATSGPTLTFVAPPITTGIVTINVPNISICSNSFQILNAPIIISEGANNQFNAGLTTQTLNLVLPAGFQFDVSSTLGVPNFGTLTLQGTDFLPGSGSLSFLSNSILTIRYRNGSSLSRDKIIISGLRVIAASATTGNIFRLGGNALVSSIPDSQTLATLSSFNAPFIEFDNSYSTNQLGISHPGEVVTAIPDNTQPQAIELTPYISPSSSDFGPSSFSGQGVSINILNLAGATIDVPFNITINHTDQNGCNSSNAVQYLVYNHNTAVNITDAMDNPQQGPYCLVNDNFVIDEINSPSYPLFPRFIDVDNLPSHLLENLTVAIPASADTPLGPTQIINSTVGGGAWVPIIENLANLVSSNPGSGGFFFKSYDFDVADILDANNLSGGDLADPYSHFRQETPFQENVFYTGGSLGIIEFTGEYRNTSNIAVKVPRRQLIELFLPAVPIVEVGLENRSTPDPSVDTGIPIYCEEGGLIAINGFPAATTGVSVGTFTLEDATTNNPILTGALVDNSNGTATLDPSLFAQTYSGDPYADIRIIYTYKANNSPCESSGSQIIRITPNPAASFTTSLLCQDINVQFTDGSTINDPGSFNIVGWSWSFGDPNSPQNASLVQNPIHVYNQPGTYPNVQLQARSDFGCLSTNPDNTLDPNTVEPTSKNLVVGGTPIVSFTFSGVSTDDPVVFNSTTTVFPNSTITNVDWDFGDTNTASSANLTNVPHPYSAPGVYSVNAFVTSGLNCTASLTKQVVMVDKFTPIDAAAYEEDFESDDGGWQVTEDGDPLTGSATWQHGTPSSPVIANAPFNGANVWVTNLSGAYSSEELSFLYSPCFDMNELDRPMISFNAFVQLATSDGVVLEYSTDTKNIADPTKDWTRLGIFSTTEPSGVDWYNAQSLASKPGDPDQIGDFGWTGFDNANWIQPKHILDEIDDPEIPTDPPIDISNVVFRFAMASKQQTPTNDGFAIDNVRVGNRTRTILVEHFTNKANPRTEGGAIVEKRESDALRGFNPGGIGTELIKLNYHVGFPGTDPFNQDNPADPSSRALYYNISETPLTRLDGFKNPGQNEAFFSNWGDGQYGIRTLQLAQAEINFDVDEGPDGSLEVNVEITAKVELEGNTVLHIGILEKQIARTALSSTQADMIVTNEDQFDYVLKKMLPSALGTRFSQTLPVGQVETFGPFNWYPEKARMYGPNDDLAVVVFLQNEDTREILQSEIMEDIADPPLVTGINRDIASIENVAIYPNPADDEITVELPSPAANRMRLQIASQIGVIANETTFEPGEQTKTIRTKDLAAGIYFLQLGNGQSATRKKVMIVHK